MAENRVDEFLDLYKKLEQLLKNQFGNDSGRYESVVARYEYSRAVGDKRNALSAIREIRNLLQHNPRIKGQYIIEPSDVIMDSLRELVQSVEHPRLAIDFGIKENRIYKTYTDYSLLKVIKVMQERGFSHVPVIEKGKFFGVLSAYSVFEFAALNGLDEIDEETPVNVMRDYLPIENHSNEYYIFMPKTATFFDACAAFEKRDSRNRRLVVIFITEHGKKDERILILLTPWSVVGK